MDFETWWETQGCGGYHDAEAAWKAAQQAERERIKHIIKNVALHSVDESWEYCCKKIQDRLK